MENLNSVAFIGKILKIEDILGADKIQVATIDGWTSIVAKNTHKEGDLVLCITTDAVIPEELALKWGVDRYLRKGFRVRTIKLKGVYSECILISLSEVSTKGDKYLGRDLMPDLNIYKYEPLVREIQDSKGRKYKYHQNPNFQIYYKFPNQKNTPNMFNEEDEVVITRKIHGTNARYGIVKKTKLSLLDRIKKFFGNKWIEYEYIYGSHNVEKGSDSQGFYSTDVWKEIADKYNLKQKLWKFFKEQLDNHKEGLIIYGEIYGEGIQGKHYNYSLTTKELVLFDIQLSGNYLPDGLFKAFCEYLSLPTVQYFYEGKWDKTIQDSFVNNQFIEGTKTPHEGVVVKCITGDRKKVSKVINPDYLIYSEKNNVEDSH